MQWLDGRPSGFRPRMVNIMSQLNRTFLSGIAALFLATGTAHAAEPDKIPSTGPFWISAFKISCGQKNGIWWQGMNGAGHFIRFYPSREETIDYLVKDNVLIVQGEPCEIEPFDCSIIGCQVLAIGLPSASKALDPRATICNGCARSTTSRASTGMRR